MRDWSTTVLGSTVTTLLAASPTYAATNTVATSGRWWVFVGWVALGWVGGLLTPLVLKILHYWWLDHHFRGDRKRPWYEGGE